MNKASDRIPALPLIANDPYFSVWMPGDTLTDAISCHWCGQEKPLRGWITLDGKKLRWLGKWNCPCMETEEVKVTPTSVTSVLSKEGIQLRVSFFSPALPDDPDLLSVPVTFTELEISGTDGREHEVSLGFSVSTALCYDGGVRPPLHSDMYRRDGIRFAWAGQKTQKLLCHSGDHITGDWGYLYLAAPEEEEEVICSEAELAFRASERVSSSPARFRLALGYDDIASVNYFGVPCRAWYTRGGRTLPDVMFSLLRDWDTLKERCLCLDRQVLAEAERIGGEDYALIVSAAWRHTFAAHKLIATPEGEMALLSKENDSNGCIGTVDVSYPSTPLFLRFCPELVNALCRPVLRFASLPVWEFDFAPHDVGRYPHATGQVYALKKSLPNGQVYPPVYLYPAGCDLYDERSQMPVEECGNMLIMLESAVSFGAGDGLIRNFLPLILKWVRYLDRFGDDPGEQLCTDDFAGHLARNVNLSAKAAVGIACCGRMLKRLGREEEAEKWSRRAKEMAAGLAKRARGENGTALTYDGIGWSMKYNLIWDRVLDLGLLPEEFYRAETDSYPAKTNSFGLPLDSRADYTKSDWLVWTASLAPDREMFLRLIAPLARYLKETDTRVPFSDWYDTKTGRYVEFIGRSVQGGVFMPMLVF